MKLLFDNTIYKDTAMKLSKLILTALLTAIFATLTFAQETQEASEEYTPEDYNKIEKTIRVSEFGRIGEVESRKQLDNFMIELKNNPGTTGYIVFYQGKDALPSQYALKGEDLYLPHIRFKNYEENGIVFINAFRERQATELWIVPSGGKLPELTATIAPLEAPKTDTFLFHRSHFDVTADEFLLPSTIDAREASREEYLRDNGDFVSAEEETVPAVIEKSPGETNAEAFSRAGYEFAQKFKANSDDHGVVMIYADDKMFDVKNLAADMRSRSAAMAAEMGIAPGKLEVVFGGYRRGIEIEMWVVPKAAKAPLAKPAQPQSNIAD